METKTIAAVGLVVAIGAVLIFLRIRNKKK